MKTALIVGGTGLTGKQLTYLLLADKRYSKIILLVREPMNLIHQKMDQVIFDFDNPDLSAIKATEIFCCIGTTIKTAGSKAAFKKVDFDYALMIAQAGFENGAKKIAIISSMGADKNSFFFYNKIKAEMEEAISRIGYECCLIFRPSILLGNRQQFRFGESVSIFLMNLFSFVLPKKLKPIDAGQVAKAMQVMMNTELSGTHIFDSANIAGI